MPISIAPRLISEEPLREHKVQMIFSACHRNIEQTPLFLDLVYAARAEVGRYATVDDI